MPLINELVLGYKYNNETEAINARESIDTYYGIPVSPDDITQNWVEYNEANLNEPIFWYIRNDNSLNVVLGQPIEFFVTFNTPF